jgi:uncharacterized protein (TIGR02611 family)
MRKTTVRGRRDGSKGDVPSTRAIGHPDGAVPGDERFRRRDVRPSPAGRISRIGARSNEAGEDLSGTEDGKKLSFRARIEEKATLRRTYRVGVAVLGGLVLAAGVIMIPYPGPGWLVVFAGLAILASEFHWARRVLHYARGKYDAWTEWLGRQPVIVRLAVLALTGLVVMATLYVLNAFYLVASLVGLGHWTWLQSPFFA